MNYQDIIDKLALQKHPEGGYFKEMYRAEETLHKNQLPERYTGTRNISTCIYFMLTENDISVFHKIKSDEIWHHYMGDAVEIFVIEGDGNITTHVLGKDLLNNQVPQVMMPKDHWFAAKVVEGGSYSLMGCTVAPGFDFDDFEMAERESLLENYPQLKEWINIYTNEKG